MPQVINAKGLACPQPVILTKKSLDSHDEVTVLVDNTTALENIKRLASSMDCLVEVAPEPGEVFKITVKRREDTQRVHEGQDLTSSDRETLPLLEGPTIYVFAADSMGKGSDELGAILLNAFIHTVTELENPPHGMIFYNSGVKLAAEGSPVIDDLRRLETEGVSLLVCGTCLDYFDLKGKVAVGSVSNMYEIAETLSRAGKIIKP